MNPPAERATPRPRADFVHWSAVETRWSDNDVYGHVNNVVHYGWFDTVVNRYLIERGALQLQGDTPVGLVVETQCRYFEPLAFPQRVDAGLVVAHAGRSSVRYELGLFAVGAPLSAAHGHFVHVYVDRHTRRPVELPASLRAALRGLQP